MIIIIMADYVSPYTSMHDLPPLGFRSEMVEKEVDLMPTVTRQCTLYLSQNVSWLSPAALLSGFI